MTLGNEHSNTSSLLSLKSQHCIAGKLSSLWRERENVAKAQEPNLHLLGWVRVHTVHVSEFLFTQAVVVVVICMLKNWRYL